jgi:hypothetical protein
MDYGLHRCSALDATPCHPRHEAMRASPPALVLDHDRLQWYWVKRDGSSVVVRQCPWCGGMLPDAIWIALLVAASPQVADPDDEC